MKNFDAPTLKQVLKATKSTHRINITMPQFAVEDGQNFKEQLRKMGLSNGFDPTKADFSRITGQKNLWIDQVVQKSKFSV
jgi:serpin B